MPEYVLGANAEELERLRFQQEVWGAVTADFLDRVGLGAGATVLDAGSGPGFTTRALRERVRSAGSVVALDASERWQEVLADTIASEGWHNVRHVQARLEEAELAPASFDFVFARWVFSFLRDTPGVLARLARCLRPGGKLLIQDYNHEGLSLFPPSPGFDAMVRATRELYARAGGDVWVAGRLPAELASAGFGGIEYKANVLCGGPASPAFRWADSFFPRYSEAYERDGLVSGAERTRFLADWEERKRDPGALFFSPIVVDLAATVEHPQGLP